MFAGILIAALIRININNVNMLPLFQPSGYFDCVMNVSTVQRETILRLHHYTGAPGRSAGWSELHWLQVQVKQSQVFYSNWLGSGFFSFQI